MAKNSMMLVCVLVCAMWMGASEVQGQSIPGIPGLLPGITGLLSGLIFPVIHGNVSCAVNASLPGTIPPAPFPNATVQLVCGTTVVASAITNNNGSFSILLAPISALLTVISSLFSACRLVVVTPLSACNATLPNTAGLLTSLLQFVGTTVNGLLTFALFTPIGF